MSEHSSEPATGDGGAQGSFVSRLCLVHADWLVDETGGRDEVPEGWRPLVERLFASVAEVVTARWGEVLALRRVRQVLGALELDLAPSGSTVAPSTGATKVRRLLDEARGQALRTCSVCGADGRMRLVGTDYVTLCDVHASKGAAVLARVDHATAARADAGRSSTVTLAGARRRSPAGRPAGLTRAELALYDLDDVAAAIGVPRRDLDGCSDPVGLSYHDEDPPAPAPDGDQHARLRRILDAGEVARWRELARPGPTCLDDLDALRVRAPHMSEMTALVRRHLLAATNVGLPIALPPVMLSGPPGVGKSWYLGRLARLLRVPFRTYNLTGQSLADGLYGAHGTWRNAKPGLVARTLLAERVANPLVLVDEVDKAGTHASEDPYRAFYDLLEPEAARGFRDEYLQFPIDASRVVWVLAGNDPAVLPAPILDRLTVVEVPRPGEAHLRAVAASVYQELNVEYRLYFDPELPEPTLARLLDRSPRALRKALAEAMTRAASEARGAVEPDDVPRAPTNQRRVGF